MNNKYSVTIHVLVGIALFVAVCAMGNTNFNIPVHIAFFAYMIYLWVGMIKKANAYIPKVDSFGTWDDIRLKIHEINPHAKPPGNHSSQRYIWFARQNYDFGDSELAELKKAYLPYVTLFYGLFIAFVFKLVL